MTVFLIADPHFFHDGIIQHCNRPFASVSEMNEAMTEAWRAVVRPGDEVIVVGDFAHRADPGNLHKLFSSLPGDKHLVVGNHDGPATMALPWKSIRDVAYTTIDSQRVVLCHYAWRTWPGIRRGALMLYGHNHGRLPGNSQSMDIGVDVLGFGPVRLSAIKARLAQLPPMKDPEGGDDLRSDGIQP